MRLGRAARGRNTNTRDNMLSYVAISTVGSEKNIVIVKAFVPCDVRGGGLRGNFLLFNGTCGGVQFFVNVTVT